MQFSKLLISNLTSGEYKINILRVFTLLLLQLL